MESDTGAKKGELIPAKKNVKYPVARKVIAGTFDGIDALFCLCANFILFPVRLLWNLIVIVGSITLTVLWLGFVFGSVVGVILLLIFMPEGFLLPLALMGLVTPLWKECN